MSDWIISSNPPAISTETIKRHCRVPVDFLDDDPLINEYVAAAIAQVERITERVLGQGTAVYYGPINCGQRYDHLEIKCLPLLPDQSETPDLDPLRDGIISVEYLNTDGDYEAIDSANWQLSRPGQEPATLIVTPGFTPELDTESATPYKITIRVGYHTLPPSALQAIKLWAGECYRCREVMVYGQTSTVFKQAFDAECRSLQWRFKG